ncbi:MAG TPA: hypothetical protein VHB73_05835, partial [Alphaproteobacteria bacterium]|nr:hypothetical protein [Alphaproteobacteria bacterium]
MHVDHSLLNQIIRAYYGKSNRTQIRQAAALSAEELLAPVPRTAAHSAVLMQRTPRFYLRENVVDAIRKLYARS